MNSGRHFDSLEAVTLPPRPLHLAIGMFDGVHLGHRAVIDAAVLAAKRDGGLAAVLTFWPHPSAIFRPEQATRPLQDPATRAQVLLSLGLDAVFTQAFTLELSRVPAEGFVPWLRERLPNLAGIYVGENFRFGAGRRGDVSQLRISAEHAGVSVFSAPRVCLDGEAVSSTRIRSLLEAGAIDVANRLLGYSYFSNGRVTAGKRLGRTIGFPTLNLAWAPLLRPKFGVYLVRVSGPKSEATLPGVANYGLRPTVENSTEPRLEIHLLGDCPFDADDDLSVQWLRFLRPEMKFSGLGELREQISRDRDAAKNLLGLAIG